MENIWCISCMHCAGNSEQKMKNENFLRIGKTEFEELLQRVAFFITREDMLHEIIVNGSGLVKQV